MQRSDKLFTNS